MPLIPITIGTPVLTGTEKFRVRYRLYPNGIFSAPQDETNAPFNISVPDAGEYEIEIIHVLESGTLCPAVYRRTIVAPDYDCDTWDFTPNMIEDPSGSGLYFVQLNYGTSTNPPCGWTVIYNGNSTKFSTLPTSPLRIPSNNTTQRLIVRAEFCNGNSIDCVDQLISKITPPEPPACEPVVMLDVEIILEDGPLGFQYYAKVTFTQSNPQTPFAHFLFQQQGTPRVAGTPLDQGSFIQINPGFPYFNAGGNNRYIILKLNPTPTIGQITYNIRMRDQCNVWHSLTGSI